MGDSSYKNGPVPRATQRCVAGTTGSTQELLLAGTILQVSMPLDRIAVIMRLSKSNQFSLYFNTGSTCPESHIPVSLRRPMLEIPASTSLRDKGVGMNSLFSQFGKEK